MRLRWHLPFSLAITMFELHGVLVDIINYLWLMSGRPLSFCNGIKKDHNFSTAKSPHETNVYIMYVIRQDLKLLQSAHVHILHTNQLYLNYLYL